MENLDILIGIFVNLSTAIILWTIDYFVEHKGKFRFTLKKKKSSDTSIGYHSNTPFTSD